MDITQYIPDKADFSIFSGLAALISFVGAVLLGLIAIISLLGGLYKLLVYVFHLLGRNPEKAQPALATAGKLGLVLLGSTVGWAICTGVFIAVLNAVGTFSGGGGLT